MPAFLGGSGEAGGTLMYILDTNICSYFMRNQYPDLTAKLFSHNPDDLAISSVTVFELEYGAGKRNWGKNMRQKMAMFLAPFSVLPFTVDDAVAAGNIRCTLEKLGESIGPYDTMIAAQGLSHGYTVITHNIREFIRVPGLHVEDWVV